MWFFFFFAFIAVSILHALYFSRVVLDAVEEVWPTAGRWRRVLRRGYLVVSCSMPAFLLLYAVYFLIASPKNFGFPESTIIDVLVIYPFWFVTIWSFQCSLFIVPLGLLHWLTRKLGKLDSEPWHRRRRLAVLAIAAIFLVYVPARTISDRATLKVRHHQVAIAELPAELEGFEIALIADPQADRFTGEEELSEMVEATMAEDPDLVLVAGDIITRPVQYIEVAARNLGQLKARQGVFVSIGDHDNFAYRDRERSLREVREGLAKYGVPMLDNQIVRVEIGDADIAVIVATNNYVNRIGGGQARKLIEQADDADVQVLVAHQTGDALIEASRDGGVDLLLSGHTHGGQVSFLTPLGLLVLAEIETPYISGLYRVGPMSVVVSSGIGMSVAPFRYHSPKTVDIITLKRSSRPAAASAARTRAGARPEAR